jgi:hypothetical protein
MDMTIKVSPKLFKRLVALRDRHGDNTIADYLDRITEGPAWSLGIDEELAEEQIDGAWLLSIIGPVCKYWEDEDAVICGHGSCYEIMSEQEQDEERHPDAYPYGEPWGPDNPAPGSPWWNSWKSWRS